MKPNGLIPLLAVVFMTIGAALLTAMILCEIIAPGEAAARQAEPTFVHIQDTPIVDYPQYRKLVYEGEVYVTICGETAHLVKSELGWKYLQRLGLMVRAM